VKRSMIRVALILSAVAGVLAACSFSLGRDRIDASAVHADLAARLAEAQVDQAQALALWDRLIFGEAVPCEEVSPAPALVTLSADELNAHAQVAAVQQALNTAIRELQTSAALWDSECAQLRESVPLAIARDGRAAAVNAAEPLSTAAALLASTWE